jgi:hypothetical protein
MKKYIFIIILSIITLANVNWASAQTATNPTTACNNKKNGDACEYTGSYNGTPTDKRTGFCDRTNGDSDAQKNPLKCKVSSDKNGWTDCVVIGDACKSGSELGVCKGKGSDACDTTKKPTGNPGGSTSATCGGAPCEKVCATINGSPRCVDSAKTSDNKCAGQPCEKVCATINGSPRCVDDASKPGTPADNGTTPDASSPQTVGFINPSRFNSITELIAGIINALLGILGAITVAVLVSSGFKYMTSSNPGEVGQALDGIRNAIVGLMIIMGAFLITQYVISALVV